MINMLHSASAPGLRDSVNPVRRRRRFLRRRPREERLASQTATPPVLIPRP